jgi:hypothetical protein
MRVGFARYQHVAVFFSALQDVFPQARPALTIQHAGDSATGKYNAGMLSVGASYTF